MEQAAGRTGTTLIAFGSTPVGFAYYRLAVTTASVSPLQWWKAPDRQESQVLLRTLVTSHLGATVQQSFGAHVTLGATVKLVRGGRSSGDPPGHRPGTRRSTLAERIEPTATTRAMSISGAHGRRPDSVRAGVVVRNVTEPTFGEDDASGGSRCRGTRASGVAWGDRWPGISQTIVAFDADLTDVPHARRRSAGRGGGRRALVCGRQVGVRGGVRGSTVGDARPVVSGGASFARAAGTYVDAYVARGRAGDRAGHRGTGRVY